MCVIILPLACRFMGPELNAGYSFVTMVVSIFGLWCMWAGQMLTGSIAVRKGMFSL